MFWNLDYVKNFILDNFLLCRMRKWRYQILKNWQLHLHSFKTWLLMFYFTQDRHTIVTLLTLHEHKSSAVSHSG